jgi:ZipA, C-terminal FtsZ-binding domain
MNPLFLGLLAAGAILVVGVLVYNWIQEHRLRRRRSNVGTMHASNAARDAGQGRAEPMLGVPDEDPDAASMPQSIATAEPEPDGEPEVPDAGETREDPPPPRGLAARPSRDAIAPDGDIECIVWMTLPEPAPTGALTQALGARAAKPMRWLGRGAPNPQWRLIDGTSAGPWQEIAACMLLANRSGAASREELEAFMRLADPVAASLNAECVWPDERDEAARAEALDRLCADLDVQIGLSIVKTESGAIAGTRLRGVAEAAGFRLGASGSFEHFQEDSGALLYSLQNLNEQPFTLEGLRALSVGGVLLLLDVPRVPEPVKAFDQMRLLAKRLAQTLEATLVDDNRRPLDDAALGAIRAQVQATAVALREAQIEPGGQRALRLFG